eukprot:8524109-Alexandrium_andersonii.AAC.1
MQRALGACSRCWRVRLGVDIDFQHAFAAEACEDRFSIAHTGCQTDPLPDQSATTSLRRGQGRSRWF